ncbi:hypothetical protein CSUI_005239 [Cystoisospora suis]|uniref:Uncharacterized protein n=1 Tax=Cystoisospora suis TaxID=483139 RepID=A0A2C6KYR1_9APIC|nr:hypothetical protein CSUI_005239 [Cystoisospora suis]
MHHPLTFLLSLPPSARQQHRFGRSGAPVCIYSGCPLILPRKIRAEKLKKTRCIRHAKGPPTIPTERKRKQTRRRGEQAAKQCRAEQPTV